MRPRYRNAAIVLFFFPILCGIVLGAMMIYRLDTPGFLSVDPPLWMQVTGLIALYSLQAGIVIGWPVAVYLLIKGSRSKM